MLLEDTPVIPRGWKKLDNKTPDPTQKVQLSFALHHPNAHTIQEQVESSHHLSQAEAQALREPNQKDVKKVLGWLKSKGLAGEASTDRDWVHVKTTVKAAESLLDTTFNFYQFEDHKPVLRTREYYVPKEVHDAIDFIHPIANFMLPQRQLTSQRLDIPHSLVTKDLTPRGRKPITPCSFLVTPDCLLKLYNINYKTPNDRSSIRLGIAGFLEENANYRDSDKWLQTFAPTLYKKRYNYTVENFNGGKNSQVLAKSGGEAALDVQYAMGVGFPAKISYYLGGGRGVMLDDNGDAKSVSKSTNEPYLELLEHLLNKTDRQLPHVLSISYADDELSVPRAYAKRVCDLFGLLTSRGVSVLVASGDGGTKGSSNSNCRTNDGSDRDVAMAVFPSTCPWVTSIGAVSNNKSPPHAASFSGGGFSQYFEIPSWQKKAVAGYVSELNGRMKGYYSPSYRAVPDISAVGTSFVVQQAGKINMLQGTSASTPLIAAMIALINDARVRKGKPVLGWLNKKLYSKAMQEALEDTVKGAAYPCKFRKGAAGWPVTEGWDAVTGLGVPQDFSKFMDVLMKM
ncbi:tripeptidyl peptidase precursor [Mariannaea sp. PMI_226]|nr:tripeptidyl peptidase precursor [Mariannaea sp. PMI_226]